MLFWNLCQYKYLKEYPGRETKLKHLKKKCALIVITLYKHFELCINVKMVEGILTKSLPQSFLDECHLEHFDRS